MSKAKMEIARELIKEKNYTAAREILKTVDHPTAREWIERIDQMDPFGVPSTRSAPSADPAVAAAITKDYTNAAVIVLILYFVLWLPGLIANQIYLNQAKQMEALAGQELPGVRALRIEKLILATIPLVILVVGGVLGLIFSLVVASRY